jgi:hypothetical protein
VRREGKWTIYWSGFFAFLLRVWNFGDGIVVSEVTGKTLAVEGKGLET